MATYKYTGNRNAVDYTNEIVLAGGKTVPLGGTAEFSDSEYDSLKERFVLEEAGSGGNSKPAKEDKPKGQLAGPQDN